MAFAASKSPMKITRIPALVLLAVTSFSHAAKPADETRFLTNIRQLTFEGRRAGEGYFSPDGKALIFQSERETENPFYQIYLLNLESGDTRRVSPFASSRSNHSTWSPKLPCLS